MFERLVKFHPAYDKRDSNPCKNYGIHGVELEMVLKGEKGAVDFYVSTNWHLPDVQNEINNKVLRDNTLLFFLNPSPASYGYHSPHPTYNEQTPSVNSCAYLNGGVCYSGCSGLQAERIFNILLEKGSDGVWEEMEKRYYELFENRSDE